MPESPHANTIWTVVGFTAYPWEHALASLRLVEPIQQAGLRFIQGNLYDQVFLETISAADLVVIQRDFPRWLDAYLEVIARTRAARVPLVYEVDDLLLELPETHPDVAIHYYTPALLPMLHAILAADALTVTTPALAETLRPLNQSIWVLPNYLTDRLWPLREPVPRPAGTKVVLGYVGSDTHQPDLEYVAPALTRLLERFDGRLALRFWGSEPPPALRTHPAVEATPLQILDYAKFAGYFSTLQADLFIAPLVDSNFNRCKSSIKYLEYSASATPGVYSRVPPYEMVVKHGVNGFLASTPQEWESCLARLIEDQALRCEMGRRAQATVREGWLLSQHAHEWAEAYRQVQVSLQAQRTSRQKQAYLQLIARVACQARRYQDSLVDRVARQEGAAAELAARLEQSQRELQEISGSRAWRLIQDLWRLRLALIPHGSRRERLVTWLLERMMAMRSQH